MFLKKFKKSISIVVLSMIMSVSTLNNTYVFADNQSNINQQHEQLNLSEVTIYNSMQEYEASNLDLNEFIIKNDKDSKSNDVPGRYQGGYSKYVYKRTVNQNDKRIGYHPSFPSWKYVDGYYFSSSSKVNMSVSLSYGPVSVSVAKGGGSGFFKSANGSKLSRPWVRADISTKLYDMYLYDDFGKLIGVYNESRAVSTSSDVQIFVEHK